MPDLDRQKMPIVRITAFRIFELLDTALAQKCTMIIIGINGNRRNLVNVEFDATDFTQLTTGTGAASQILTEPTQSLMPLLMLMQALSHNFAPSFNPLHPLK
jgi:hypothetical protein